MAARTTAPKRPKKTSQPVEEPVVPKTGLVDDVDAILDEIDRVLEKNANEVLVAYQQKGGQ